MGLAGRLTKARTDAGLSKAELARHSGISAQAIGQIERGIIKSLNSETASALARALRLNIEWLARGVGTMRGSLAPGPGLAGLNVPVLDIREVSAPHLKITPIHKEVLMLDAELSATVSNTTYALRVEEDSMRPEFVPGDFVIVDPARGPQPGDIVVAQIKGDIARLKRYRPLQPEKSGALTCDLVPANQDYPTLRIDHEHPGKILGTVVEHRRRLR